MHIYMKANWLHGAELFLRGCQLCRNSRTSQHITEQKGLLSCSLEPCTSPYLEPDQSSQYHLTFFSPIHATYLVHLISLTLLYYLYLAKSLLQMGEVKISQVSYGPWHCGNSCGIMYACHKHYHNVNISNMKTKANSSYKSTHKLLIIFFNLHFEVKGGEVLSDKSSPSIIMP